MFHLKALFVAASLAATMSVSAATITIGSATVDNGNIATQFEYGSGALIDYQLNVGDFSAQSEFLASEPVGGKIELSFNQQSDFIDGIFSFNGEDFAISEDFVLFAPLLASNTLNLVGTAIGDFTRYTLNVSQVPIPAALLLMAPLLLGAFGLRRKLVAAQAV